MTGTGWDMIVPGDDAELAAEFRGRGVRPGDRVHVTVSDSPEDATGDSPMYFGSFDGPNDLAERSEAILRAEFPARADDPDPEVQQQSTATPPSLITAQRR